MSTAISCIPGSLSSAVNSGRGFYPKFTSLQGSTSDTLVDLVRQTGVVDLDYDALNVFFRIGTFLGTDTPYLQIKAAAPDYEWATSRPTVQQNRAQIIDSYIDLFRQSIKRCNTTDWAASVGLSGGRDSRHILLELCRSGRAPSHCWTIDIPSSPTDTTIAKELCGRLGVAQSIYHLRKNYAEVEAAKDRLTDFSSLQHGWLTEAILNGITATPVLFDGIAGDVLSVGYFLTEFRLKLLRENKIDELVEDIVGQYQIPVVRDTSLFPRQRALEKVNEEFRKHLGAPDPISSFYFWNRTRRDIGSAPFAILRHRRQTVFAPYLDPDLSSFLAGLRPAITLDHKLHTDVIAKAYPEFADLPYAEKSAQPVTQYRRVITETLRYILANKSPMICRYKVVLQLVRSLFLSSHSADVLHLGPNSIYLTELWKLGLSGSTKYA